MSNPANSTDNAPKRKWPFGLYGCFSYQDRKGNSRWCPDFCLFSLVCSNLMAGRVYSQVNDEEVCFNGLGTVGCLVCLLLIPLAIYSPLSGLIVFGLIANYLRLKVIAKHNVEEDNYFCCGSLDPCLNFVHNACNYPCSLFQMNMAMEEWDEESPQNLAPVVATPIGQER